MAAAFPLHQRINEGPPEMTGLRLAFRHGTDRISPRLACSGREGADGVRSLPAALVLRPVPADMRILENPGAMVAEHAVHLAFIFTIAQLVIINRIPSCVAGAPACGRKRPPRAAGAPRCPAEGTCRQGRKIDNRKAAQERMREGADGYPSCAILPVNWSAIQFLAGDQMSWHWPVTQTPGAADVMNGCVDVL